MQDSIDRAAADKPWNSRWFLPAALGVAAVAEFLSNRLAQPFAVALWGVGAGSAQVITWLARFSLNLATVLGVMGLGSLLLRSMQPGGSASRPLGRMSVLSIGSILCGLATLLIIAPDGLLAFIEPKRVYWLLQLSSVSLSGLIVLGLFAPWPMTGSGASRRPISRLYKAGVALLLLPPLLLLETQWGLFTNIRALQRYGFFTALYGPMLGVVAVTAIGAGALCLSTIPPGSRALLPLLGALVTTTGLTLLLSRQPNLTIRLIAMSFDLRLPPNPEAYALYLLSLCGWVFSVLSLLVGRPAVRTRGLGLLLIGLGGCQARSLHQTLFYLAGLLCIVESLIDQTRFLRRAQAAENSSMPTSAA